MQLLSSLALLVSCNILLLGCRDAPKVTVCVSDPQSHGFWCQPPDTAEVFALSYDSTENYVAFSPDDAQALLTYCKSRGKP